MTRGIWVSHQSNNVIINGAFIFSATDAIYVDGASEGVYVHDLVAIYVGRGVYWNAASASPLLEVTGGHVDAFYNGVRLNNAHQSVVQGVVIYKRGDNNFVGIYCVGGDNNRFIGNMIRGAGGGTENGIVLDDSQHNTIIGNSINEQDTAIWLQSDCTFNSVVGTTGAGNDAGLLDEGANNPATCNFGVV